MLKCIAIDDEPLALRQIAAYVAKVPYLELVASTTNALEAQQLFARQPIDLLFVDINMPDLNGIDLVRSLIHRPMVIFTTAYSEYAVEGFRLDAIDYLLKPFSFADFSRAAAKAYGLYELRVQAEQLKAAMAANAAPLPTAEPMPITVSAEVSAPAVAAAATLTPITPTTSTASKTPIATSGEVQTLPEAVPADREYLSVKADYKVSLLRIADIIYIESEGEYVRIHLADGTKLTTLFRIKNMEASLPSDSFMRIHRCYIVNLHRIKSYVRGRVYLNDKEYLPIGENYKETFRSYIERTYRQLG